LDFSATDRERPMADQLSGMREPDLILTSPTTATPKDDGYLLGSGNAALKLDAEWVSCNLVLGIEAD